MKILPRNYSVDAVKDNYSKLIKIYDLWAKLTEEKALEKTVELAEINNGESILEVAVGTGKFFEKIIKDYNPTGRNIGVDISPAMLEKAKRRLAIYDKANYQLKKGNALNLKFEDDSFDLVVNNYMLDLFPKNKFDMVIKEFKRVLKADGRLIITTMSFGNRWYHKIWYYIAKYFPGLLTGCRPISLEPYLQSNGFEITDKIIVSQNTFASEIIKAKLKA